MQAIYNKLDVAVKEARAARRHVMLGGDFNAEAKSTGYHTECKSVGRFANPDGNLRGEWLVAWAGYHDLRIANTLLQKRWEKRWTHRQHGRERIIDYILIDRRLRRRLYNSEVCTEIDMGSDHRSPCAQFKLERTTVRRKKRGGNRPAKVLGWVPKDVHKYKEMLDVTIKDVLRSEELEWKMQTIEAKCSLLEKAVRETALQCKKVDCQLPKPHVLSDHLQQLLQTRRQLAMEGIFSAAETSEMAKLSKHIQKEFRKTIRKKHQDAIAEKVNNFKDLRSIAGIQSNGKRRLMASILDESGQVRHDQKEVLDVFGE